MPVVAVNTKADANNKVTQKGPATDYSMLLEMKKRSLIVSDANANKKGRKAMGTIVDNVQQRGFTDGPAVPALKIRGATLGFFKF